MTIATCRPRSSSTATKCCATRARRSQIRGEKLDLVGVRFWTRRARDIARLVRGAEVDGRFCSRTIRGGSTKRPR